MPGDGVEQYGLPIADDGTAAADQETPDEDIAATSKRLPFAGEFSPGQVDLRWLLEAASRHAGDRAALVEAIRAKYYADSCPGYEGEERIVQQTKRAGNVVIGMKSYGLLSDDFRLSELGRRLLALPDDPSLYEAFARNILVNCYGMDVLQAVESVRGQGLRVTKKSLSRELVRAGFDMPRDTTKHLIQLRWLHKAGVMSGGSPSYSIDKDRLGRLLHSSASILTDLDRLGQNERYFLRALVRMTQTPGQLVPVQAVVEYAETLYPIEMPAGQLRARLLEPLADKGWIELTGSTRGRGARSGQVRGTGQFESEYVRQLLEQDASDMPVELRTQLRTPINTIVADLTSTDRNIKGQALELLALKIASFLDLEYRKWRLRSSQSGEAEVDLIVEGARLVFTRWQIQCKNAATVSVEDLAKEVGLAVLLKSQVIMLVTTGRIGAKVRSSAETYNSTTAMQVVLIDGELLQKIASDASAAPLALVEALNAQARSALRQKAAQIEGID